MRRPIGEKMFVRVRYFPVIFLALVVALILLIPYYYSENWSFVRVPSKATAEEAEVAARRAETTVTWRVPALASSMNEIDDRRFVEGGDETIVPQAAPPLQPGGRMDQYRFAHLTANIAEFALQMARDRIEIERFGLIPPSQRGVNGSREDSNGDRNASDSRLQVMVVTYFRGGTTFFGDLLNQLPGTFYHFEPLHMISLNDQVSSSEQVAEAIRLLRRLLRCQYESVPSYIEWARRNDNRFLFEHNRRLWLGCQFQPALCYDDHFLSGMCHLHPIHIFKLVRLRLSYAKRLLDEFPGLRFIYLVRDPRGLYSSRRDLAWCNGTQSCIEPASYCGDMRKDLTVALWLRKHYPDRFLAVRYEDVALDPKRETHRVLDFLKLTYNAKLERFIESHTQPRIGEDLGGPYSTKRNSKKAAFSWRRKLSPHEVDAVESVCGDVIRQLALP